ncbi:MAG: DUF1398 family protein [Burkholderiaceae bacterium]|nr:DUF1398 family protein [Burkholderiaceae bacterium]
MNANIISRLGQATVTGEIPFPEIVGRLIAEGVEYYHVDYACLQMQLYGIEGGVVRVPLLLDALQPIAPQLDKVALRAAIVDSQQNGQKFKDFSRRAVQAGVAGYFAFLGGKRVTYLGRQGDQHIEWFPGAERTDT